jgi:hypothetical protein
MTPYCVQQGFITPAQLTLFHRVVDALHELPSGLDCHEVCHRIAQKIDGLVHVKGRFNHWDHSWFVISGTTVVIDVYPWACGTGPFMVDCRTSSPWATLYKEESHEYAELDNKENKEAESTVVGGQSQLRPPEPAEIRG